VEIDTIMLMFTNSSHRLFDIVGN